MGQSHNTDTCFYHLSRNYLSDSAIFYISVVSNSTPDFVPTSLFLKAHLCHFISTEHLCKRQRNVDSQFARSDRQVCASCKS